jgi:hypothetical protein
MKFRVFIQLTGIVLSLSTELAAQSFEENALLFSRTRPGGSARMQAIGGAQIALGGDFSSALSNPAGLGMYNRSEFTFTPALNFFSTEAKHLGTTQNEDNSKFTIPGLSYVFNSPNNKDGFWGGSFGISMTRTNDFNSSVRYSGVDNLSSMVDWFLEDATGAATSQLPAPYENIPVLNPDLPTWMAYWVYLINPFSADNPDAVLPDDYINYYSEVFPLDGEVRTLTRTEGNNTKGAQYQWSLAYGGNYKDVFFFGANIGITTLRYTLSRTYTESDFSFSLDPLYKPLDYFTLDETTDTEGSGINLTLGVVYRPTDYLQFGAAFASPTYYQLTDSYSVSMEANWDTGFYSRSISSPLILEYNLTTPMKLSFGTAFFLSDYGFISGDIEFINYKKAKYASDISGISFNGENDAILASYQNTVNYRIGGEFRLDVLRFRAGYNVQSNPYNTSFIDTNRSIQTLSAGLGLRLTKFFIDFALLRSTGKSEYSPYVFQNNTGPLVSLNNSRTTGMLTVGFTF